MRNKIIIFIKILISSGLIYYLLRKTGVEIILLKLESLKLSWIILGIFIFSISNLLGSLQWYILLKHAGVQLKYVSVVRYYYIGLFYNNIFISNMGGDFFRLFYIAKHQNNSSAAISTVFLDRFFGFTMLTFLALIGSIYWYSTMGYSKIGPVLLLVVICWILVILVLFNQKLAGSLGFVFKWFLPARILIKLREIYDLIYNFSKHKRLLALMAVLSFFIQIIRILTHYIAGRAIGVDISFVSFLIFIPLIAFIVSLPISIGGLGVREQTAVILFRRVGVLEPMSIAMEFLAYLLTIICSLPGLIFFIITDKRRNREKN